MALQLGIGIGIPFIQDRRLGPPFKSDQLFDFYKLDPNTLRVYDKISDDVEYAVVQGGYVSGFDGASSISIGQVTLANLKFTMRCKVITLATSTGDQTSLGAGNDNQLFRIRSNTWYPYAISSTGQILSSFSVGIPTNGDTLEVEYIPNDGFYFKINDLQTGYKQSIGWTGFSDLDYYIGLGSAGDFHIGELADAYIESNDVVIKNYHLNNHAIDSITGVAATWIGTEAYKLENTGQLASTKTALTDGFLQLSTGEQIIGYRPSVLPAGSEWIPPTTAIHNGVYSFMLYPTNAAFDRSDVTVYEQAARDAVTYDSVQPALFYVGNDNNERKFDNMQSWLVPAEQNKQIAQMKADYCDIQRMSRDVVYGTAKTGDDLIACLNWAEYNCIPAGYEAETDSEGNVMYDSEGKLLVVPIT